MAQLEKDPTRFLRNLSRHAQEYGSKWIPVLIDWYNKRMSDNGNHRTLERAMRSLVIYNEGVLILDGYMWMAVTGERRTVVNKRSFGTKSRRNEPVRALQPMSPSHGIVYRCRIKLSFS